TNVEEQRKAAVLMADHGAFDAAKATLASLAKDTKVPAFDRVISAWTLGEHPGSDVESILESIAGTESVALTERMHAVRALVALGHSQSAARAALLLRAAPDADDEHRRLCDQLWGRAVQQAERKGKT